MKSLNDSSIIICSIVRNASRGLKRNISVINDLCNHAKSYKVVIYENDSIDNTKNILCEWAETQGKENIHVLLNDTDPSKTIPSSKGLTVNPFFSRKRIDKMTNLRNKYLEYIKRNNWTADYLMVVDLDVESIDLDGILSSFLINQEWDAITAFGYSLSPKLKIRYHDTYALVEKGKENIPQTENIIYKIAEKYGKLRNGNKLLPVFSAFGGLSIYKFEAISGLYYQTLSNSDPRVEVRCEHFSIYKQMSERGYDKVYISPCMKLKYQQISFSLIFNTLKRMFGL